MTIRIKLTSLLLILFSFVFLTPVHAQDEQTSDQSDTNSSSSSNQQTKLRLSIRQGDNASVMEFRVSSGDSVFVPVNTQGQSSNQIGIQPNAQGAQNDLNNEMVALSQQIIQKQNEIDANQKALDNEIFLNTKAQLKIEKNNLRDQMQDLLAQKTKIEAEKNIQQNQQQQQAAMQQAQSTVMSGLYITPTLQDGAISVQIRAPEGQDQQAGEVTLNMSIGQWVQVPNATNVSMKIEEMNP